MPGPEVLDRLAGERIVWLRTLRPDGSPHVTPVWFLFRDDEWRICTQERNRKVRNVVGRSPGVAGAARRRVSGRRRGPCPRRHGRLIDFMSAIWRYPAAGKPLPARHDLQPDP
ncbi:MULTISPECIES: pyridoxamine 5'-phosphate oxidase family protein [unclassified Micromonospora]|uniref:pyridoxamine 5'-phosphate oxidase family protein n=1 Tax=unclassified Micromonospora TaxID=2617518 RepID=UPI003641814C